MKNRLYRTCPCCGKKGIDTKELETQKVTHCLMCTKPIEVNAFFSWGVSILLCVIAVTSFKFDFGITGLFFTLLLVLYSSGYHRINSRYLPLKSYQKP
ncbi:MAG: hypothetical protein AAGB12_16020 [Pseudomonadota bacterium]